MRSPLQRFIVSVLVAALGWGIFYVADNLWNSRHDNTPISTSSTAATGGISVTGKGVTLTFPRGWVNVPKTPNEFARAITKYAATLPQLSGELKSYMENPQAFRTLAMFVYDISTSGRIIATTNVQVVQATTPPSQILPQVQGMAAQFGGTDEQDSVTTFGRYSGVLITYTVPGRGSVPTAYGAAGFIHGPSDTPVIDVTTVSPGRAVSMLRQLVSTIKFS